MEPKKINIESLTRLASFKPDTFNAERNTVDLVWSTGARVKRSSFWTDQAWYEELSMERTAVKLDRLNAGAQVLDNHNAMSLRDSIGVVEKASLKDGEGLATVRFSSREDVQGIVKDIKDGIIRNISVGYKVNRFEEQADLVDGLKVYRATDWEPMEISFVNIPADAGAQVRNESQLNSCNLILRGESKMEPKETKEAPVTSAPVVNLDAVRAEAVKAEQARVQEINDTCESLGLSKEISTRLVTGNVAIEAARKEIIAELAKRGKETHTTSANVQVTNDEAQTRRQGMFEAIMHRADGSKNKLTDLGRQYRNLSLMDMVRVSLDAAGVKTFGMTKDEMVRKSIDLHKRGMHSTSDFPLLLADTVNKTLRDSYQASQAVWQAITKQVEVPDFKTITRDQLGDAPALSLLPQNAEIQAGTMSEAKESYALATYAKKIRIGRQAIVNDDLNAFVRIPQNFGIRAAEKESDLLWTIILANAALSDAIALFHASHNNLAGTAAAISVTSLGLRRSAMRKQQGLDGARIAVDPVYLFVPPELETVADQFVSSVSPTQGSEVNPFMNRLKVLVEPRLSDTTFHASASATAWYLTASASQVDILELARLAGEAGPVIESEDMFDSEGMQMKCRYDLGAKAIDYRGLQKNAGV